MLKLVPYPEAFVTLLAYFPDNTSAARAVARIVEARITPCALELMDRTALECVRQMAGLEIPGGAGSALLSEVDGAKVAVPHEADRVEAACRALGAIEVRRAADAA